MIPLYDEKTFNNTASRTGLPLRCECCGNIFRVDKNRIQSAILGHHSNCRFCSNACRDASNRTKLQIACTQCYKTFTRKPSQIKNSKSGNYFCSRSCAVTWNNTHKKHGTRRSKLEKWIEEQLTMLYPDLEFHFNRKDTINSELDIYVPSLRLAFELNGIFHYEPIFGPEKLASIQNNDDRKMQACLEKGIEFCVIDSSSFKHFKPKGAQRYFDIITNIINAKLSAVS